MIEHAHITAWQTHAPWPKLSQIEQDLRLARGVAAIFSDPFLREHLAMRGGTVLHKAHLAPAARYSEDIDLVLVKPLNVESLDRHLRQVLTPVLGQPTESFIADAWLTLRNVVRPSKILRTSYRFVPLGLKRQETIKVEVNLNESISLFPLVIIELDALDNDGEYTRAQVRSYDINEMLGTKTRALMQREQGRDLFDLCHAWDLNQTGNILQPVDGAKAMEAFTWYLEREGAPLSRGDAHALLDNKLRKQRFRKDMDTLLRPGLPMFDVDRAAEVVRSAYFSHL